MPEAAKVKTSTPTAYSKIQVRCPKCRRLLCKRVQDGNGWWCEAVHNGTALYSLFFAAICRCGNEVQIDAEEGIKES